MSNPNTIYDVVVKTASGEDKSLSQYAGKVLLIVNVASQCGYTPQYKGLEELNKKYKDAGLEVLGFPSNDFGGQEPGTIEEIKSFCEVRFGASFDLFDKVSAKGANQHPLYAKLTQLTNPPEDVSWNFEKFLINKKGELVGRFKSKVTPESSELISAIEAELAA
jgi:glutathione peroxidase